MASILNVDKIRANGSTTDALTIDSSGRVLRPVIPAFHAKSCCYRVGLSFSHRISCGAAFGTMLENGWHISRYLL